MERLERLTRDLETPYAVVDGAALAHNTAELVRRAGGVPVRVASKSLRVREILDRTLAHDGYAGVMSYSLAESIWLADEGHTDLLLAYPSVHRAGLRDLVAKEHRPAAITLMVDSLAHLDLIDAVVGTDRPPIRVCIDVDSSLEPFRRVHLGARRSPVHSPGDAIALARAIAHRKLILKGVQAYGGHWQHLMRLVGVRHSIILPGGRATTGTPRCQPLADDDHSSAQV